MGGERQAAQMRGTGVGPVPTGVSCAFGNLGRNISFYRPDVSNRMWTPIPPTL